MSLVFAPHEPVNVIFGGGLPARFVFQNERWVVTSAQADGIDWIAGESRVISWVIRAQIEDGSDAATFELVRNFSIGSGWMIDSVSFA